MIENKLEKKISKLWTVMEQLTQVTTWEKGDVDDECARQQET